MVRQTGRTLLDLCIAEAHGRGIGVLSLHASDEGRPLYERVGFKAGNEMQRKPGAE
jgi:hypothetical protein